MRPFFETHLGKLYKGDCLEVMASLEYHSIDLVLADLPYGVTNQPWDKPIQFPKLWWLDAKVGQKRRCHPLVRNGTFQQSLPTFQARMVQGGLEVGQIYSAVDARFGKTPSAPTNRRCYGLFRWEYELLPQNDSPCETCEIDQQFWRKPNLRGFSNPTPRLRTERYPDNLLPFPKPHNKSLHSTEKSLELCKYLIETYSLPDQVVLDNTAGSGTSLLAAEQLGREWIGIELLEKYCQVIREAVQRRFIAKSESLGSLYLSLERQRRI